MMSPRTRRLLPRGGMGDSSSSSSLPQAPPQPASSTLSYPSSPSTATTAPAAPSSSQIRQLGESSIRRIVAEQAICDLSSIVKELVDNSIDAGSKSINIRLFGQGLEIIEVSDDGSGVPPASRPLLATRYATSKIRSLEELYSGSDCLTMGFRGEALFSLANLSNKLVVATRTEDEELATKLEFLRDGSLDRAAVAQLPRKIGTTVAVVKPFYALPARRADMARRIRAERQKLFKLLESYAIFCVGVRIQLIDIVQSSSGGSREDVAVATSASSTTIRENVSSVLGHKFLTSLSPLNVDLDTLVAQHDGQRQNRNGSTPTEPSTTSSKFFISGLISKNPQGAALPRIVNYFCINGRPVELPSLNTVLRKVWQAFGGKKRPNCLLHLRIPNNLFDINLAPDKRQVLLTIEHELCETLSDHVTKFWSSQTTSGGVFPAHESNDKLLRDIAQAAVLASESQVAPEADESERQRHKRRNAFVHDLAKAKMQHEHDHRICRSRSRSPVPPKSSQSTAPGTPNVDSSSPQDLPTETLNNLPDSDNYGEDLVDGTRRKNKKGRIALTESPRSTTETTAASASGKADIDQSDSAREDSDSTTRPNFAKEDVISDRDRIQWTAMQQKFNRTTNGSSNDGLQSSQLAVGNERLPGTIPVTPDEESAQHTTRKSSDGGQMAPVPILNQAEAASSGSAKKNSVSRGGTSVGGNRLTTLSLGQFSYRSDGSTSVRNSDRKRRHDSNNDVIDSNHGSSGEARPSPADKEADELESAPSSEDNSSLNGGRSRNIGEGRPKRRCSADLHDLEHKRSRTAQSDSTDDSATQDNVTPSTSRADSMDTQDGKSRRNGESVPKDATHSASVTAPTVVWRAFGGTEEICRASRVERLKMRERKNGLKEIQKLKRRLLNEGRDIDDGDSGGAAVGESVGIDYGDENPTSTTSESVLSLSKEEFRQDMQVIGQFNMGFILARCRKNHIWILDQHACDEKYNFENLCRTTVLHEQRLLAPMSLELTSAEEACILDHMDIFKSNGFHFKFDPKAQVRHRLSLTALPHSGARDGRNAVVFGKEDVSALCAILLEGSSYDAGDGGTGTDGTGKYGNNAVRRYASMSSTQSSHLSQPLQQSSASSAESTRPDTADRILARLPKAIAMFASRACRTSIMIGTSLSQKEMKKVVQRLADVEHPWNCPHGRPTMRHVGDLFPVLLDDERKAEEHIAGPTMTVVPLTQHPEGEDDEEGEV